MAKIDLDKYYTSQEIAKQCIDIFHSFVDKATITEYIEPSAGSGSFSLQIENCIAYDIAPEHSSIIQQDFLELDIDYQFGRCFIGNPPFGNRMSLAQKFFKKCVNVGEYIAFILPISQLWNTNSMYEFNLIHSQDLGKIAYSDRKVHCCFNIYKRPLGKLNKKIPNKIEGIEIVRQDSKKYDNFQHDIRMCYWGNGSAGRILKEGESYSAEYKIKIDHPRKEEVIRLLNNVNWWDELNCVAMLKIQQFHILNLVRKYIIEDTVVDKRLLDT